MPIVDQIDKSLMDKKAYNLLVSVEFAMKQIKNRFEAIEKEVCSHHISPDHLISLGWDMIDWSEKLRKLLEVGRGFKKKDDWCKRILAELEDLKNVRHFIQHFDGEVGRSEQSYLNLIGSLDVVLDASFYPKKYLWSFHIGNTVDLAVLQQQSRAFNCNMAEMAGVILKSASLSLAGKDINLKELRSHVGRAQHELDNYLLNNYFKYPK